ncbi:MAG: ferric reductase-like transmembrane domain-containing protein [bacterium]|nr:ferric reductase-like transmembrane domain-containing protein [bacterium]
MGLTTTTPLPGTPPPPATPPPHPPAAVPAVGHEALRQYGVAAANALALMVLFSSYLLYRRGYYDLYIANKVFANTAAVVLGVVLLLGPLAHYFTVFDRYLKYRKELGVMAAVLALMHSLNSLFFLPDHFTLQGFLTRQPWPFFLGLTAAILLTLLWTISRPPVMAALGGKYWWFIQQWGVRIAFVLVALHVALMKWSGWIKWYQQGGGAPSPALQRPWLPGLGLLVGWFMAFVLAVRIADLIHKGLGRIVWYFGCVALPVVYVATFWWGLR